MDEATLAQTRLEQAPDALIFVGPDGVIREWNAAARGLFGHSREQVIGQSLDLIIPERFRDAHWAGYRRALAEGHTRHRGRALPTRSMRKDRSAVYVELTFAIVHDHAGRVIGALAIARDITERWLREREKRDQS